MREGKIRLLSEYITTRADQMVREPEGMLRHPFTVPSAPDSPLYKDTLWDWDTWTISIALGQVERDTGRAGHFRDAEHGSILNYLDHTDDDGVMPIMLKPTGSL